MMGRHSDTSRLTRTVYPFSQADLGDLLMIEKEKLAGCRLARYLARSLACRRDAPMQHLAYRMPSAQGGWSRC